MTDMTMGMEPQEGQTVIDRNPPQVDPSRAALAKRWTSAIQSAKAHPRIKNAFRKMREDMRFAAGCQYPDQMEEGEERYLANLVQRHINQTVAALYAKNPKAVARRKPRMEFRIWDGKPESLMAAMQALQEAAVTGIPPAPGVAELLQDAQDGVSRRLMLQKVADTLEILFKHYLSEQTPTFKKQMKHLVRRAKTCGIGYVKLDFQRIMEKRPEIVGSLADATQQISTVERLAADAADGEFDGNAAEAEELSLASQALQAEPTVIVREGPIFSFPMATRIIPDPGTRQIDGWIGTNWLAEEFLLTPDEIKEVYGVDIGSDYTSYSATGMTGEGKSRFSNEAAAADRDQLCCVWEVQDRRTGMKFTVADGYADFLREPAAHTVKIEGFFNIFPLVLNPLEDEKDLYPPSDVRLLRSPQIEYNRTKESLRQHRIASRPLYASPKGAWEDEDQHNLAEHEAHDVIMLEGLADGENVANKLQQVQKAPIDPNVYETNGIFEDILRIAGSQEANLGGAAGATATESSIAEGSRISSLESNTDDLDELLTTLARATGQLMLMELSVEKVIEIVGPGAAWPNLDREAIVSEIFLEIEAGSSGRPNAAQELANLERVSPLLVQTPGISPRWIANKVLKLVDSNVDLDEAFIDGLPSLTAMNALAGRPATQPGTGDPATDPGAQGDQGGNNAPQAQERPGGSQPAYGASGAVANAP